MEVFPGKVSVFAGESVRKSVIYSITLKMHKRQAVKWCYRSENALDEHWPKH